MHVIDVIPLSRTAPGVLSYRSKSELPVGTIVSITIRKTATQGIVIDSIPVKDAKEMLKHARFLLSRSIPAASGMLPDAVMKAAERTALYHATTAGAVLAAMFGEHIRTGVPLPTSTLDQGRGYVRALCEKPLDERAAEYAERIRSCIGGGKAALLIVPTIPELAYWKNALRTFKPLMISGTLSQTRRAGVLEQAIVHQGLIIATPSFSWLPIEKLGLVIADRISAGTYTLPKRPYLSVPYALEALLDEREIPFLLGDFPLPLEYRVAGGISKPDSFAPVKLIDARKPKDAEQDSSPWKALPPAVLETIQQELTDGGRAIILAARKGYAPAVVCRDCGQAQTDERGMPYSFSLAEESRVFQTSDGVSIEDARHACQRCDSWNLMPLGVGIERVEEEIRAAFPDIAVHVAYPDVVTSPKKMRSLMNEAQKPRSIVIGTESLLPWFYAHADGGMRPPLGVIASADSLLSLPFWRARERFVRLVYFLNGLCREMVLITRHPEDTAVVTAADPSSSAFWDEERMLRTALQYPPFGTLITLAVEGSSAATVREAQQLRASLEAYKPVVLPARQVRGALWRTTLVMHLAGGVWPEETLSAALRMLPPSVRVRIDPESIW